MNIMNPPLARQHGPSTASLVPLAEQTTVGRLVQFLKAEDGPMAGAYAVMLALIVVVCLVAITAMGTAANKTFGNIALQTATAGS